MFILSDIENDIFILTYSVSEHDLICYFVLSKIVLILSCV